MTPEKTVWLWEEMQKYRTLFSDLTRGKYDNFAALVTDTNSIWFEIIEEDQTVGIVYFMSMNRVVDCEAHIIFFDRKLDSRVELCKAITKWMFDNFPLNRISAIVPEIYFYTVRLAKRIGFQKEGVKRQALLMQNRWIDQIMMGLLRSEVPGGRIN